MRNTNTLDVGEFIDSRRLSAYQWVLVVLCFAIVTVEGMDVAIMGFIAPAILDDWQVSRPAFGMVMGAAPIGLAIGALFAGSSSDWFGRRKLLIVSVAAFGLFSILCAFARTPQEMALLRLLTGLGLGAAMPNTTTLLAEYVPQRSRSFLISAMFTGFNLGSALIGFIAAYMLPHYGWQSVLILGGVLPLALVPILFFFLPESARFMVIKQRSADAIRQVLSRVCSANLSTYQKFVCKEEATPGKQPITTLFASGFRLRTMTLWLTYFMGLLVIYLTTSWLPTMMKDAGMSIDKAANITAMFQLGGTVGAILVGLAMDRFNPNRVIATAYFAGALSLIVLGLNGLLSSGIVLFVVAVGFCLSGAQTGLNAYAPGCYPTQSRATGVSWMLGIGRLGSILGSSIGGVLLSLGWGFEGIFSALALPAVIAAIAILVNRAGMKTRSAT